MSEPIKIALCGNPNVGKSTVFNTLTGLKQHTGNWTGKTVDLAHGNFDYHGKSYTIYDLPGTYSLLSHSKEEKIARDFLCSLECDMVMIVCDAVCLERNLNFVLQVLEIRNDVLLCVNLMDEAHRKRIDVDIQKLQDLLGIPVVGISAKNKKDINRLLEFISMGVVAPKEFKMDYSNVVEEAVLSLQALFPDKLDSHAKRFLALKLLDDDFALIEDIIKNYQIDEDMYRTVKDDLIEEGYDTSHIRDIYTSSISLKCEEIAAQVVTYQNPNYLKKDRFIDKILTSKTFGLPIMFCFLFGLFWITMVGANYPSEFLFTTFEKGGDYLHQFFSSFSSLSLLESLLVDGVYKVVTWIVAVMLPPMAIFFPLFTLLEDLGFLPRIAFNLDCCFKKCKTCGKQALTMMMGFGCNAVGVTGARIIDSKRERLIAILTNSLVPCNGRFPTLISILTIFFVGTHFVSVQVALYLCLLVLLSVAMTFLLSRILAGTVLKGMPSSFILELPPYRKPQICKTLVMSITQRTLLVLGRALKIAAPAGIIIWILSNVSFAGDSLLIHLANILDPLGSFIGLDGVILLAFVLGFPANEIVVPLMMMIYMKTGTMADVSSLDVLKDLLLSNGWTLQTAICFLLFMLFHFPCSTTILTIHKETGSVKWSLLAFFLPLLIGILLCIGVKGMFLFL